MNIDIEKYLDGGSIEIILDNKYHFWYDQRLLKGTRKWYSGTLASKDTSNEITDEIFLEVFNTFLDNYNNLFYIINKIT